MKCSPGISNLLKRSLVFPILLFSSISLHCSLKKAFFSLLAILWNSAFRWVYLSLSSLPLDFFFLFSASSDKHFAFLQFFFLGMVLITASWSMLGTPNESILWAQYTFCCLALDPSILFKAVDKMEGQWFRVEVRACDCLHIPQM